MNDFRPRGHRTTTRRAPVVLVVFVATILVLTACNRVFEREPDTPTPPPPVVETEWNDSSVVTAEPAPPADEPSDLAEEAVLHLAEGRYRTAATLLDRYVRGADANGHEPTPKALWHLALVHLLPDSPVHDPELARSTLERLAEEHRGTVWDAQARWAHAVLLELEQMRSQAVEQEALLRQLTETVEQLRRIDLNRRPTGSGSDTATTRADTIPSPPGPTVTRRR